MRSMIILFFSLAVWGQDLPISFTPRMGLAFNGTDKHESERKAQLITENKIPFPLNFNCGFSGEIISKNVQLGGGALGITGNYYDLENNSIFSIGGGTGNLQSSKFLFQNFPPGVYLLTLNVGGKTLYSQRINLPINENIRNSFNLTIDEPKEFIGEVKNIPKFSMDSPIIGIGSGYFFALKDDGKFHFSARANSEETISVIFRFSNPFKEWDNPLYHYIFHYSQENASSLVVPSVGNWKCSQGKVEFDKLLLSKSLDPVRKNISIRVVSQDKQISYECSPDEDGNFMLIGLPDGKYNIDLDVLRNPPFYTDPKEISVMNHNTEDVKLILHAIK